MSSNSMIADRQSAAPPVVKRGVPRAVQAAIVIALLVRLVALLLGDLQPYSSIRETYFATAAGLASGYGYITETPVGTANNNGFKEPMGVVQYMKLREAAGGKVDREHPFPKELKGWPPGTRHPHGYGTLVWLYYSLFNYTGSLWALHLTQIFADAVACVFVFLFARNVFDTRIGVIASWLYAMCPPAVFMSIDLLPDAFHGFFISMVMAAASCITAGGIRQALVTGLLLGLGCYFRSEYMLLPAALFIPIWAAVGSLGRAIVRTVAMTVAMIVTLLPIGFWMKSSIGEFRLTSTVGGGGLYVCIGEDPGNPWGIVCNDGWIHDDALKHGFESAWSAEANRFYGEKFKDYVKQYPVRYLKTVLTQRLPLALATPYETGNRATRSEFNFTKYRIEEGLTRWGVLRKYPLTVLKYMWPQFAMLAYSGTLTMCVLGLFVFRWRDWRRTVWLLLPWAYPVMTISLFKMIEPRNMGPTLVPALVSVAVLMTLAVDWRRRRSAAV